jgi:hypothetical protein
MKRKSKTKKFKVKNPLFTYNSRLMKILYNTVQKNLFSNFAPPKQLERAIQRVQKEKSAHIDNNSEKNISKNKEPLHTPFQDQ